MLLKILKYKYVLKIALAFLLVYTPFNLSASRVDDLKNQIGGKNSQITEIEMEIRQYESQLLEVGAEKQTLERAIQELNISRNRLLSDIRLTEKRISAAGLSIEKISLEIWDKQKRIRNNGDALAETLRKIHEADNRSLVEVVLSYNNISDFWGEIDEIQKFQVTVRDDLETLRILKEELGIQKTVLESERSNLNKFNTNLYNQKLVVDTNKKEKDSLLGITKNEESTYQELLRERVQAKERFERELQELESALRVEIDPDRIPPAGKGILRWPLDNIFVTQKFGKTSSSGRLYASGTHNGVDFRSAQGTRVKSSLSGEVVEVGNTDLIKGCFSYGKWVLLRHGNGLSTLYAHLSHISVSSGESVDTGDIIGYSGNTGYSTGPHLHMSLFASQGVNVVRLGDIKKITNCGDARIPVAPSNAYLDPLSYL